MYCLHVFLLVQIVASTCLCVRECQNWWVACSGQWLDWGSQATKPLLLHQSNASLTCRSFLQGPKQWLETKICSVLWHALFWHEYMTGDLTAVPCSCSKLPAAATRSAPTSTTPHGACSRLFSCSSAMDGLEVAAAAGGSWDTPRSSSAQCLLAATVKLTYASFKCSPTDWHCFHRHGWRTSTFLTGTPGWGSMFVPARVPRSLRWSNWKRSTLMVTERACHWTWRTGWQAMMCPAMAPCALRKGKILHTPWWNGNCTILGQESRGHGYVKLNLKQYK